MRATLWGVVVMAAVTPAFGQFRLYDAQRDAAAQSAKQAADKISGGDVFRKEAQNLKILADKDIATTVADARLEMQGMINGLNTWSDVVALVDTVSGEKVVRTPTDIAARKAAIAQKRTDLSAQIKALGDAAGQDADELRPVINTLGGVEKALNFAETHLSLQDPGVDAAIAVLDKLQTLYKSYQDEFAVVNQAAQTLTDLKIAVKRALLQAAG